MIEPISLQLEVKEKGQFKATIIPTSAAEGTGVTWKSSDTKIVTVNNEGEITARKEGTAKITATSEKDKNISKDCEVTVKKKYVVKDTIQPRGVSGDGYSKEITIYGRTYKLVTVVGSYGGYQWYGGKDGGSISSNGCGIAAFMAVLTGYPEEISGDMKYNMEKIADFFCPNYPGAEDFARYIKENNLNLQTRTHNNRPANSSIYYEEVKEALKKGHNVIINLRENSGRFGRVYDDAVDGPCSHWCTLLGLDEETGNVFCTNNCGDDRWYSLEKLTNQTYNGWGNEGAGPWIEIWKDDDSWITSDSANID